jgi:hypothetical protein
VVIDAKTRRAPMPVRIEKIMRSRYYRRTVSDIRRATRLQGGIAPRVNAPV